MSSSSLVSPRYTEKSAEMPPKTGKRAVDEGAPSPAPTRVQPLRGLGLNNNLESLGTARSSPSASPNNAKEQEETDISTDSAADNEPNAATTASAHATNASAPAINASEQATHASEQATNASEHATPASEHATNAATIASAHATSASEQATNAATQATHASEGEGVARVGPGVAGLGRRVEDSEWKRMHSRLCELFV